MKIKVILLSFLSMVSGALLCSTTDGSPKKYKLVHKRSPEVVDINARLRSAVRKNQSDLARYLLENGAYIKCQDKNGFTPLMIAILNGHYSMVQLLLTYKAADSLEGIVGGSHLILHTPVYVEHLGIVTLLLERNVELVSLCCAAGKTALEWAEKLGMSDEITTLLVQAQNDAVLIQAARNNDLFNAELALRYGANVNARGCGGQTPLILAAQAANVEMCELLLSQEKIDVTLQEYTVGGTALHWAVAGQHKEIIKKILEKDSSARFVQDNEGLTPYEWAQEDKCSEEIRSAVASPWEEQRGVWCQLVSPMSTIRSASSVSLADFGNVSPVSFQ